MNWWTLPGPQSFIDSALERVAEGKSVVLRLPSTTPPMLVAAIRQHLEDIYIWEILEAEDYLVPIDDLYAHFVPEAELGLLRSAATLACEQQFAGRLLLVEGITQANWPAWYAFLLEYEHASRSISQSARSQFIIALRGDVANSALPVAVGISSLEWDDWVRPLDILLYSSTVVGRRDGELETDLTTALVAGLSVFDPGLCDYLAMLEFGQLLDPTSSLIEYGRQLGWNENTETGGKLAWCQGVISFFKSETCVHPALLALRGNERAISRLIWEAEIAVLMPYIEKLRQRLLETFGKLLKGPFTTKSGEVLTDIYDLEIGLLEYILSGIIGNKNQDLQRVRCLKQARNSLSHLEPVEPRILRTLCADDSNRVTGKPPVRSTMVR